MEQNTVFLSARKKKKNDSLMRFEQNIKEVEMQFTQEPSKSIQLELRTASYTCDQMCLQ